MTMAILKRVGGFNSMKELIFLNAKQLIVHVLHCPFRAFLSYKIGRSPCLPRLELFSAFEIAKNARFIAHWATQSPGADAKTT
jgi:hypothetical protein